MEIRSLLVPDAVAAILSVRVASGSTTLTFAVDDTYVGTGIELPLPVPCIVHQLIIRATLGAVTVDGQSSNWHVSVGTALNVDNDLADSGEVGIITNNNIGDVIFMLSGFVLGDAESQYTTTPSRSIALCEIATSYYLNIIAKVTGGTPAFSPGTAALNYDVWAMVNPLPGY